MKKVLILIDCQYDFINGKLMVEGSEEKMIALARYIKEHANEYITIIASVDWHPITHCSFADNSLGGTWPIHCVQFTHGAAIYQPIMDAIADSRICLHVLTKGDNEDKEEYSVLKNASSNKALHSIMETMGTEEVDFAGIADIYCVKDSIEDFHREFPHIKVNVFPKFIGNMDEEKFNDFLHKNEFINVVA